MSAVAEICHYQERAATVARQARAAALMPLGASDRDLVALQDHAAVVAAIARGLYQGHITLTQQGAPR